MVTESRPRIRADSESKPLHRVPLIIAVVLAVALIAIPLCGEDDVDAAETGDLGNITWELDNGVLTLTAKNTGGEHDGEMGHYTPDTAPFKGKEFVTLKTVGVKNIGINAFHGSTQLKKIEFDGSLTIIEACAFENCGMLEGITFGSGLKTIGDGAFSMCYVLKTVELPAGLTTLGAGAFKSCYSLCSVTIPSSLANTDDDYDSGTASFCKCTSIFEVFNRTSKVLNTGNTALGGVAKYALNIVNGPGGTTTIKTESGLVYGEANGKIYAIMYEGNTGADGKSKMILPFTIESKLYDLFGYFHANIDGKYGPITDKMYFPLGIGGLSKDNYTLYDCTLERFIIEFYSNSAGDINIPTAGYYCTYTGSSSLDMKQYKRDLAVAVIDDQDMEYKVYEHTWDQGWVEMAANEFKADGVFVPNMSDIKYTVRIDGDYNTLYLRNRSDQDMFKISAIPSNVATNLQAFLNRDSSAGTDLGYSGETSGPLVITGKYGTVYEIDLISDAPDIEFQVGTLSSVSWTDKSPILVPADADMIIKAKSTNYGINAWDNSVLHQAAANTTLEIKIDNISSLHTLRIFEDKDFCKYTIVSRSTANLTYVLEDDRGNKIVDGAAVPDTVLLKYGWTFQLDAPVRAVRLYDNMAYTPSTSLTQYNFVYSSDDHYLDIFDDSADFKQMTARFDTSDLNARYVIMYEGNLLGGKTRPMDPSGLYDIGIDWKNPVYVDNGAGSKMSMVYISKADGQTGTYSFVVIDNGKATEMIPTEQSSIPKDGKDHELIIYLRNDTDHIFYDVSPMVYGTITAKYQIDSLTPADCELNIPVPAGHQLTFITNSTAPYIVYDNGLSAKVDSGSYRIDPVDVDHVVYIFATTAIHEINVRNTDNLGLEYTVTAGGVTIGLSSWNGGIVYVDDRWKFTLTAQGSAGDNYVLYDNGAYQTTAAGGLYEILSVTEDHNLDVYVSNAQNVFYTYSATKESGTSLEYEISIGASSISAPWDGSGIPIRNDWDFSLTPSTSGVAEHLVYDNGDTTTVTGAYSISPGTGCDHQLYVVTATGTVHNIATELYNTTLTYTIAGGGMTIVSPAGWSGTGIPVNDGWAIEFELDPAGSAFVLYDDGAYIESAAGGSYEIQSVTEDHALTIYLDEGDFVDVAISLGADVTGTYQIGRLDPAPVDSGKTIKVKQNSTMLLSPAYTGTAAGFVYDIDGVPESVDLPGTLDLSIDAGMTLFIDAYVTDPNDPGYADHLYHAVSVLLESGIDVVFTIGTETPVSGWTGGDLMIKDGNSLGFELTSATGRAIIADNGGMHVRDTGESYILGSVSESHIIEIECDQGQTFIVVTAGFDPDIQLWYTTEGGPETSWDGSGLILVEGWNFALYFKSNSASVADGTDVVVSDEEQKIQSSVGGMVDFGPLYGDHDLSVAVWDKNHTSFYWIYAQATRGGNVWFDPAGTGSPILLMEGATWRVDGNTISFTDTDGTYSVTADTDNGYRFVNFQSKGSPVPSNGAVVSDMSLTAKFNPVATPSFDDDDDDPPISNVDDGDDTPIKVSVSVAAAAVAILILYVTLMYLRKYRCGKPGHRYRGAGRPLLPFSSPLAATDPAAIVMFI